MNRLFYIILLIIDRYDESITAKITRKMTRSFDFRRTKSYLLVVKERLKFLLKYFHVYSI